MDIDTAPSAPSVSAPTAPMGEASGESNPRSIKLHPLAIIGISDHHTRVMTGGSKLPPSAPVVGLLFGYYSADGGGGRDVSIIDAEEMEYPRITASGGVAGGGGDGDRDSQRAAIFKKIELYRKVFPQHRVVGWYRVQQPEGSAMHVEGASAAAECGGGDGAVPSAEDLRLNQTEMTRYCRDDGADEDGERPLFLLMHAPGASDDGERKPSAALLLSPGKDIFLDKLRLTQQKSKLRTILHYIPRHGPNLFYHCKYIGLVGPHSLVPKYRVASFTTTKGLSVASFRAHFPTPTSLSSLVIIYAQVLRGHLLCVKHFSLPPRVARPANILHKHNFCGFYRYVCVGVEASFEYIF